MKVVTQVLAILIGAAAVAAVDTDGSYHLDSRGVQVHLGLTPPRQLLDTHHAATQAYGRGSGAAARVYSVRESDARGSGPQYAWAYEVAAPSSGDRKAAREERRGDMVVGQYSLVEADGSLRVVDYFVRPETGFRATINTDGEALARQPTVQSSGQGDGQSLVPQPLHEQTSRDSVTSPEFAAQFQDPQPTDHFTNPLIRDQFRSSHPEDHFQGPDLEDQFQRPQVTGHFESQQFKDQFRSPQLKGTFQEPEFKDRFQSPQLRDHFKSPQLRDPLQKPQLKDNLQSPQFKDRLQSPELKDQLQSPQSKDQFQTPVVPDYFRSPQFKDHFQRPEFNDRFQSPQVREQFQSPQVREQFQSPQLKDPSQSRRVEDPSAIVQLKDRFQSPQVRDQLQSPQFQGLPVRDPFQIQQSQNQPFGQQSTSQPFTEFQLNHPHFSRHILTPQNLLSMHVLQNRQLVDHLMSPHVQYQYQGSQFSRQHLPESPFTHPQVSKHRPLNQQFDQRQFQIQKPERGQGQTKGTQEHIHDDTFSEPAESDQFTKQRLEMDHFEGELTKKEQLGDQQVQADRFQGLQDSWNQPQGAQDAVNQFKKQELSRDQAQRQRFIEGKFQDPQSSLQHQKFVSRDFLNQDIRQQQRSDQQDRRSLTLQSSRAPGSEVTLKSTASSLDNHRRSQSTGQPVYLAVATPLPPGKVQ